MNSSSLKSEFKELFAEYFERYPKRNLSTFARMAGLSDSTTRRLASGDSVPSFENSLKALIHLYEEANVAKLYTTVSNSQKDLLRAHLGPVVDSANDATSTSMEDALMACTPGELKLFLLLATAGSRSRENVEEIFGTAAPAILERLSDRGLIEEVDGDRFKTVHDSFHFSERTSAMLYSDVVKECYSTIQKPGLNFGLSETVSEKGFEELKRMHSEYIGRCAKVLKDNPGEKAVLTFNSLVTLEKK